MSDPKNCPWCGGRTEVLGQGVAIRFQVYCPTCFATGPRRSDEDAAAMAWNSIAIVWPSESDGSSVVQCPDCGNDDMEDIDAAMVGEKSFQWHCDGCGMIWPIDPMPLVGSTLVEELERLYPQPPADLRDMTDEEAQIP